MKLILLKPWRLLFWLRLLSCLPVQNTNCSFRFLSYGPTHPSVLAQTQDLIHKVFLPSFPLQSVETPGMVFLFPCLRLPYASCAEVPNDITKITLFAVNFGCSVRGPSDRSPLSWAVLWVYWSHLLSHCSHWEPSISCISVTVPSPSYQPTPSTLKHHWTGHQGCKSLQFLRCLFCCHRRFSAPAASPSPALSPPLSGKLQQVRAETCSVGRGRGSGPSDTAPAPSPVPTHGTSLALCSQPVSVQCSQQEQLHRLCCSAEPSLQCCRRGLEGTSWALSTAGRHLCLSNRVWLFKTSWLAIPVLRLHCLPGPSLSVTNKPEPFLFNWLGFQCGPSLLLPSPQQANHALLLVEIVCSKALCLALSETS